MNGIVNHMYLFLSACSGNWRNAIYIIANSHQNDPGYLLAVDRDGHPVVMSAEQFQQLSGEQIDPAECCGQLAEEGFKVLYAQYLLWHISSDEEDPLRQLSREFPQQE